jgi:hypothetical protein
MTSVSTERAPAPERRSRTTLVAFVVGLPLAVGVLGLIHFGPWRSPLLQRYTSHPVEVVEVLLFGCALGALGAKLWASRRERAACRADLVPPWDGRPVPVAEAAALRVGLDRLPRALQDTYLVRRTAAVLAFLSCRGSATDLDDHLRALADNDALVQEASYALIRFITWAIPILGFLGTVLGITDAIAGVTPEVLEQSLSTVTDGLALAFDTTALALALTMVLMFLSFVTDRAEQAVLEQCDRHVDRHLAHRFERTAAEGYEFAGVVHRNTQILIQATEQLVQRQAAAWARALEEAERHRTRIEERYQDRLTTALEAALERTLETHACQLAALEKHVADQTAGLVQQLAGLAGAVREQHSALAQVAQGVAAQVAALARLQEGERQLVHLQEVLQHNLAALAGAGAFEQAVHSLTAAVHLLTARAGPPATGSNRLGAAA